MERQSRLALFFCIGTTKTGSTLLANVLDRHPKIACIVEAKAFEPDNPSSMLNPQSSKWRRHGFSEEAVRLLARQWSSTPMTLVQVLRRITKRSWSFAYMPAKALHFRCVMSSIFADFASRCYVNIVGDKTPGYIGNIQALVRAFPDAKFIYGMRDPRAVYDWAYRYGGDNDDKRADHALNQLLWSNKAISPYLARPNFTTVRYEDLVCESQETLRHLYEFLGCDFSIEYLHYNRQLDPYPDRWYWNPNACDPIDPYHATEWKKQMSSTNIQRVSKLADWFIEKYGYSDSV